VRRSSRTARLVPLLKTGIWIGALAPLGWLVYAGFTDQLTADPIKYLTHHTGRTTLVLVFLTLSVTPIRRLSGWNPLIRVRRPIGLFAFFYAVLHLAIYFIFDRGLALGELGEDIAKRPYITVGFTAWLILLALAVTSPAAMVRRLGRHWQRLHRLIYAAAGLGLLHFAWAQKKDLRPVLPYAAVLAALVTVRLTLALDAVAGRRAQRERHEARDLVIPGGAR
jgi:sulfoxide reductase heme-binding subunit YedZ